MLQKFLGESELVHLSAMPDQQFQAPPGHKNAPRGD
jgi:hypothetical protein